MEQETKTVTTENQDTQSVENAPENATSETANPPADDSTVHNADTAEIARLKAEINRLNNKADGLAKENADQKKQLRSYKTAEEIREEERKEADEAIQKELAELRKERAIAKISKAAFVLAQDDAQATKIAEYLHGAEDPEAAINEFKKIQDAAIKKLKIEYGKIPAPGVGGSEGPMYTKEQFDAMKYTERVELATKYPDEYNRLMGRK